MGFTFPLISDVGLAISVEYGAAKDTNAATASRAAVLVDRDGAVEKIWPAVNANTFPDECLAGLKDPLPDPGPYQKSMGGCNLDKIKPSQTIVCKNCNRTWSTEGYDKNKCPFCLTLI